MKIFQVPGVWDGSTEIIQFKPIKTNLRTEPAKGSAAADETKKATKAKKKKNKKKPMESTTKGPLAPRPVETTSSADTPKVKSGRIEKRKNAKKQKKQLKLTPALAQAAAANLAATTTKEQPRTSASTSGGDGGPAAFAARLKEQLMGGRFRYLNEQLYTMNSDEAVVLFRDDRDAFEAYHAGYRHQVEKWPCNPLDRIIKMVRRLPKSLEIVDFGCGEGKLALSVPHKVHSLDLVSTRNDIIACDMANTPLHAQSLDVAVYCLSLMGTNMNDYLLEANRVLKTGGLVYIAEIQSRFEEVHQFVRVMKACGFELVKKEVNVKLFYFFEFQKERHVGKVAILPTIALKPCLYRKR